jgi:predicted CDP-diglyceride synthetase/phosphatidate cytidylyltransferase
VWKNLICWIGGVALISTRAWWFVFSGTGKLVLSSSENMALFSFFSLECLSLFEFVSFLEILWPSPAVNMSLISHGE